MNDKCRGILREWATAMCGVARCDPRKGKNPKVYFERSTPK